MENIYTKRLVLRPYREEDLDAVHSYLSDKEVTRYMILGPFTNQEETKAYLDKIINQVYLAHPLLTYEYAVEYQGQLIGGVSIEVNDDQNEAELGWVLHPGYQRKGLMSEAAMAIKMYAIEILKIPYVYARCDGKNIPSQRLMRKIGLHKEKVIAGVRINKDNGHYEHDEWVFSCRQ